MPTITAVLKDERGVALVMAMIMLVAMTGLMMASLTMSALEPQISQNLATTIQGRFVADAGLEWGFGQLATPSQAALTACLNSLACAQALHWNTLLAMPNGQISGVTPMQIPGPAGPMSAAFGTFVVQVRNDTAAADQQVTGVAPDPAVAAPNPPNDVNGVVIVQSSGTVRGVTRVISAAVRRPPPVNFTFNGAISFPGTEADVSLNGNSFEIDGRDYRMPPPGGGNPANPDGVNPAIWGVSTSTQYPANEAKVEAQVSKQQQDNIQGKQENTAKPGQGANTVNADPSATSQAVHDFIKAVAASADMKLSSSPSNPLSVSSIHWGTPMKPIIVHVKATTFDPTSKFTALSISGSSEGYGILIVEDGDLRISGNFRWNGPIIVSGRYVGVGFMGGGNQSVYGSVISNEMATNEAAGFNEGVLTGNAKVRYSKEALDSAINALFNKRSNFRIYSWREN